MALEAICCDMPFRRMSRRKFLEEEAKEQIREQQLFGMPNLSFVLPPFHHPKSFVDDHFGPKSENRHKVEFLKGTTTLAFTYKGKNAEDKGGIIVAVDARATSGQYISSKSVMKILDISDKVVATMAGGAADCQFFIRILSKQCSLYELRNNEKMSVAAASKWLSNILYQYKGMGISVGSLVAGCDKLGSSLYMVMDDGTRLKGEAFSLGSGCTSAISILDMCRKTEMTDKEAIELARKAIMHATYRDVGSGGVCNMVHITPAGKEYKEKTDVSEMFYDFMKEMKREPFDPDAEKL